MSAIISDALKAVSDPLIPFITRPENFTTAQIRHDSLLEFGRLIKAIKITNNDAIASVLVRTQSPSNNTVSVDPNSELIIREWTSFLQIIPDAVTGSGQIEFDLVKSEDAYKQGTRLR